MLAIAAEAEDDDATRVEAAAASITAGDWDRARRLATSVTSEDPVVVAGACLQLTRACWFAGDIGEAAAAVSTGIDALGDLDHPLLARLHVEQAHQLVRTEEATASTADIARAAVAVAARVGVDMPRAHNVLATALAHDGLSGWEDLYRQVIPAAAAAGDADTECSAAYFLASHLGFAGRYAEAVELLEVSIARASALGEVTWRDHMTLASITDRFMSGGDPAALVDDARRFIEARPVFRNRAQAELALALSLGDVADFERATHGVLAALEMMTSVEDRSILLAAATELFWMAGELPRALEFGELAAELGPGWFGITAAAAAAAALARFELGLRVTVGIDRPKVPIFETFQVEIDGLRAWSDGDSGRAIALLDDAVSRWRRCGPQRYSIRAQWTAGVMACRIAHPSAGRRLVAVEQEAGCAGLAPIARRAAMIRHALGQTCALTTRETDALLLVADGCTSKQIAERLEIAPSTVESHIASAVRKLGARNRRQAAAMLEPSQ